MAYTVAITNQKGGVGKTTTAVNLAAALAIAERRTLLVDADPQGNTTSGVGIAKVELQVSLYDVLVDDHPVHDVIHPVAGLRHLSLLPATQDLVGAELQLVERPFRESALRRVLEPLESEYDYIVVDCPPSLGLLTLNVLAAVQQLIIPIQCEYYGLEGISQLLNTIRLVQQNINPGLAIGGVLLTMYDSRLNLCRQVAEDATEYFGPKVFGTPIPRNVRLAEAPSFGKPILLYDVQSVGAKSYLAVAQELLRRVEGTEVTIAAAQVAAATAQAAAVTAPAEPEASIAGVEPEEEAAVMRDASLAGVQDSPGPVATDVAGPEGPPAPIPEAAAPPDPETDERPLADTAPVEAAEAHEPVKADPAPGEYVPQEPSAPAMEAAAGLQTSEGIAPQDEQDESRVELERLAADGASQHSGVQQPSTDGEAVTAAAPVNGAEAASGESVDEEAIRMSHQAESKPEVTT
jgi:chromosome partitioning protein